MPILAASSAVSTRRSSADILGLKAPGERFKLCFGTGRYRHGIACPDPPAPLARGSHPGPGPVLKEIYGDRVPIEHDHLVAGALLADVGKLLEYDRDEKGRLVKGRFGRLLRHPCSGVALCHKHGLPPEVMHIVATHSHEGDKVERSIESIIFHHADFVDFDIARNLGK